MEVHAQDLVFVSAIKVGLESGAIKVKQNYPYDPCKCTLYKKYVLKIYIYYLFVIASEVSYSVSST